MKDKRGGTGRGEAGAGEVAKEAPRRAPLMEAEKLISSCTPRGSLSSRNGGVASPISVLLYLWCFGQRLGEY